MIPPRDRQLGDGGFSEPRVFDTLEDAITAGTTEDAYLNNQPDDEEVTTNEQD